MSQLSIYKCQDTGNFAAAVQSESSVAMQEARDPVGRPEADVEEETSALSLNISSALRSLFK